MKMLIDEFLPEYDFKEVHDISIRADAGRVYRAIEQVDFCDSWIVRWLFRLRGLPTEKMTLGRLRKMRFEPLGEVVNREKLIGLTGQFWKITGSLRSIDAEHFKAFNERGYAKTAFNLLLDPSNDGTRLTTETRIKCLDEESRTDFSQYWTFIRPFSGLIRMEMLKTIKRQAEGVIK